MIENQNALYDPEREKYLERKKKNHQNYRDRLKQRELDAQAQAEVENAPLRPPAATDIIRRRIPGVSSNVIERIVDGGFRTASRLRLSPNRDFWLRGPFIICAEHNLRYVETLRESDEVTLPFPVRTPRQFPFVPDTAANALRRLLLQTRLDWNFHTEFDPAASVENLQTLHGATAARYPEGYMPDDGERLLNSAEVLTRRALELLYEFASAFIASEKTTSRTDSTAIANFKTQERSEQERQRKAKQDMKLWNLEHGVEPPKEN